MASPLRHGTGFNSAEVATDAAASKAQPGLFSRGAYFKHSVFVSLCAADRDFADPELVALGSALAGLDLVSADAITLLYGGAGADAASAGPDPDGGGGTDGGRDDPPVHAVFVAPDLWASVGGTEVYDMDRFVDIPFGGKAAAAAEGSGDDPPELAFPATDLDLMLYVKGASLDACFAVARAQVASIAGAAPSAAFSASYLNGFVHRGGRDLSGFVDGTRNPDYSVNGLSTTVVIQADDEDESGPDGVHVGGSFVYAGRWVHDFEAIAARRADGSLSGVIGRHHDREEQVRVGHPSNPLMDEAERPASAHIDRAYGPFFRQAYPYQAGSEAGLMLLCFARSPFFIREALFRMAGAADGVPDGLFYISTAVENSFFYCPSLVELAALSA